MFWYEKAAELQTNTEKFSRMWVGPVFVTHILDKTHYLLSNWL